MEVIDQSGSNTTAVQVNGDSENHHLAFARPSRTNHSNARGSSANNGISRSSNPGLSQFQNLSFAKDKGSTSVGVSTRGSCVGLIGLLNFGNTCFMNSAIQCLVHTPEFASFFTGDFHKEINWQNPLGMEVSLNITQQKIVLYRWYSVF